MSQFVSIACVQRENKNISQPEHSPYRLLRRAQGDAGRSNHANEDDRNHNRGARAGGGRTRSLPDSCTGSTLASPCRLESSSCRVRPHLRHGTRRVVSGREMGPRHPVPQPSVRPVREQTDRHRPLHRRDRRFMGVLDLS